MQCLHCGEAMTGRQRKYCTRKCGDAAYYLRKTECRTELPQAPVLHQGRFQDYAARYAGLVDVLITDPPYARKSLPLYTDLAAFAKTTLVPGGWFLCLTGWGIDEEARATFRAHGLSFRTVCCYHMPSTRSKARKNSSTGFYTWQEHHKPLLWFEQPGVERRQRGGGTDLVMGSTDMDQHARPWEQSLTAFRNIIRQYTDPPHVICDPFMGWGTTLIAAVMKRRDRVIGIELEADRYAFACEQVDVARVQREAYQRPISTPRAS